jgi:threonine/homoserine/homoserine lactone efflux protein
VWPDFAPFLATCLVIELTPGPNMAYLVLLSAQRGRLAGLLATAGVALGLLTIGLLAAFGVAQFVQNSPALYQALRWAGVAYLVYLAWDTWRESRAPMPASADLSAAFRRGLVTNLLNPKAYLFYITVLPGFVQPGGNAFAQVQVLTFLYVTVATLVHVALALGAGALQGILAHPKWRSRAGLGAAILLLTIAAWVAFKT